MTNPLVSVVIPSFNHAKFIRQAIQSVAMQSYENVEIIIVDDGSLDDSVEVIRNSIQGLKREVQFFKQKNQGAHAAINYGLNKTNGDFITILNSDDYFEPGRIQKLVEIALGQKKELIFTTVEFVDENSQPIPAQDPSVFWYHEGLSLRHEMKTLGFALLRNGLMVSSGNLFFSRDLYKKLKGFKNYRWVHDYDFVLRSLRFTEPFLYPKKLLNYRLHSANTIAQQNHLFFNEMRRVYEDFFESYLESPVKNEIGFNEFAPCPENWPRNFANFYIHENRNQYFGGKPFVLSLSLCNQYLLKNKNRAISRIARFVNNEKGALVGGLKVFSEAHYLHLNNFIWAHKKTQVQLRIKNTIELKFEDSSRLGVLVEIEGKFSATIDESKLKDQFVGMFYYGRLIGAARALEVNGRVITYAGFITEGLSKKEIESIKLVPMDNPSVGSYRIFESKPLKCKPPYKISFPIITLDKVTVNEEHLIINGWSIFEKHLPCSVRIMINNVELDVLPTLYSRPDLKEFLISPSEFQIAGFQFDIFMKQLDIDEKMKKIPMKIQVAFASGGYSEMEFHLKRTKEDFVIVKDF